MTAHCMIMINEDALGTQDVEPFELTDSAGKMPRKKGVKSKPAFMKVPIEADQLTFDPVRPEDLVEDDHWVRDLVRIVESFDLKPLVATYELTGHPPYTPVRMLAIWVVGMVMGFRSTRKLEEAVKYDARFVVAAKRMRPDYRTLGRFRLRLRNCLPGLLDETVRMGLEAGVIDGSDLGLDGTKMVANTRQSLGGRAHEFVERALQETEANDEADGSAAEFEEEVLEEKGGGGSDPDASTQPLRGGGFITGYNAQAAVDMGSEMAVGCSVGTNSCDSVCLAEPFRQAVENLEGRVRTLTTDKGYDSAENLAMVEAAGVTPYILGREKHAGYLGEVTLDEAGKVRCRHGYELVIEETWVRKKDGKRLARWHFAGCEVCKVKHKLPWGVDPAVRVRRAERMRTSEATRLRRLRSEVVERVFANLKWNHGWRRFLLRGLGKVTLEWRLMLVAGNVAKLARSGTKAGGGPSPSPNCVFGLVSLIETLNQAAQSAFRRLLSIANPNRHQTKATA